MERDGRDITVSDVRDHIIGLVGVDFQKDEGIHYGLPDASVKKIMVCWMADTAAIRYAAKNGVDLIVTHESLLYPCDVVVHGGVPEFMTWNTNHYRLEALTVNRISVIRAHSSLDRLCILDTFASVLGLGEPIISVEDIIKVWETSPLTYGDLILHVKRNLNLQFVRTTPGDRNRVVRRVGLPWGGLGLFVNVGYVQRLLSYRCDVFIAGETDNYGFRFVIDAGKDMIETGHDTSENPGLRQFAGTLGRTLPQVETIFYENQPPFVFE